MKCRPAEQNAWRVIHQRFANCIEAGSWNAESEKAWYEETWKPLIPGCGSCRAHWAELEKLIDWTTAQTAYDSLYVLHNRVSREFANKPEISREYCDALYLQQPSLDDCVVAVTSLAPNRFERQNECLNSWKRFGLSIIAVQSELDDVSQYPQLSEVVRIGNPSPAPSVSQMLCVARGKPVLLINSDIEIHGKQSLLRTAIEAGSVIGLRHNYNRHWWLSTRDQWGFDAFVVHPEKVRQIEPQAFQIGKPWWDYWLADQLRTDAHTFIAEPLFFHRDHEATWTDADWEFYGDEFAKIHGRKYSRKDVAEFRSQFPYA